MNKVAARHILVETLEEAQKLSQEISTESEFIDAAHEYSLCPSKAVGGYVGVIVYGQRVYIEPEFEQAVFDLDVMEVSQPLQTQFGYHVIMRTA